VQKGFLNGDKASGKLYPGGSSEGRGPAGTAGTAGVGGGGATKEEYAALREMLPSEDELERIAKETDPQQFMDDLKALGSSFGLPGGLTDEATRLVDAIDPPKRDTKPVPPPKPTMPLPPSAKVGPAPRPDMWPDQPSGTEDEDDDEPGPAPDITELTGDVDEISRRRRDVERGHALSPEQVAKLVIVLEPLGRDLDEATAECCFSGLGLRLLTVGPGALSEASRSLLLEQVHRGEGLGLWEAGRERLKRALQLQSRSKSRGKNHRSRSRRNGAKQRGGGHGAKVATSSSSSSSSSASSSRGRRRRGGRKSLASSSSSGGRRNPKRRR